MSVIKSESVIDVHNMTGSKHILVAPEQIVFQEGGCLERRTTLEKILLICLVIAIVVAVGMSIAYVIRNTVEQKPKICMTEDCVKSAAMISESMDYSVNPCHDFYDFACGSWRKKHIIPEDKSSYGVIDQLFQLVNTALKNALQTMSTPGDSEAVTKAKILYASCMNTTRISSRGVKPLKQFLGKFGGWPVVTPNWTDSQFNIVNTMATISMYNSFKWDILPLFTIKISVDTKNPSKHIIHLDQPSFGMPGREYYLKGRNDQMVKAYDELGVKVAMLLGANMIEADTDISQIVDFEIELANITTSKENRRNLEAQYNKITLLQIQKQYNQFDWLTYFQTLFSEEKVRINITETVHVINRDPEYFSKLSLLLAKTPKRIIANYLGWRVVMNHLEDLTPELAELKNTYRKVVMGTTAPEPRWRKCATYADKGLKMATGRLFVDSTFDKDAKKNILEMINNLRVVFNEQLETNNWMDATTRKVAMEKADAIGEKIGYPDEILDDSYLNNLYKNFQFDINNYFENKLETEYQLSVESLNLLNQPVDKTKWDFGPAVVNANYDGKSNYMEFPAAFLQPRFYSRKYPRSVNYGGVGMVIGHEITHGFDDVGRQYDKDGNLRQWWTDEVIINFKKQVQCVIDHYSSFIVPEIGLNINGIATQGENIADIGGLKQSFKAYRKWVDEVGKEEPELPGLKFNHDQIFFISYAQTFCGNMRREEAKQRILTEQHVPDKYRVIGPCQNSEDFARVFRCPVDSYMNPSRKCSVW